MFINTLPVSVTLPVAAASEASTWIGIRRQFSDGDTPMVRRTSCVVVGFLSLVLSVAAQTLGSSPVSAQVPPLIQFSDVATDEGGNALSGAVSITFSLYTSQQGGESLWQERQNNVQLDSNGHYSVELGITKPNGVPTTLFTSGEARWLGVKIDSQAEQPRVLLLSVPYALKAGDAATVGGLPPAAFVLAAPPNGTVAAFSNDSATQQSAPPPSGAITGTGTVNYLPLWDSTSDIVSSVLFQSGSGSTAKIGINTITPASALDIKGGTTIRGTLSLLATTAATASKGGNSQPINLTASAFNSGTDTAVNQMFQWQAEPVGNDTSSPSGTLNLLFGSGTSKPTETGLNIASNGQITFALGQTFPGTGAGTVTSVGSGMGLTGGPITASGTLAINPLVVPLLATNNSFTGNQTVSGNVTATNVTATETVAAGVVNATTGFDIGGVSFATGSFPNNAFVGFGGNSTMTGIFNFGAGYATLSSNTSGSDNTAVGMSVLIQNTTGFDNTAIGQAALDDNVSGNSNTASGESALLDNATGNYNTASGAGALAFNTAGNYNTADGYNALVNNLSSYNVADGANALQYNTTGFANTGIGNNAGRTIDATNLTGRNNTALGTGSGFLTGSLTNATAIGANAEVDESNAMVLGSIKGVNGQTVTTKVGIGTTMPDQLLSVNGQADKPGGGSWASFSDRRLKTLDGSFRSGLSQILKINPVRYRYKEENGMGIHDLEEHIGLVAQDVEKVIPEAVTENDKGYLLVNNDPIIWSMLNAIKEQQREIKQQQSLLRAQRSAMQSLEAEVRETRETLQRVKAQMAATQPALIAAK